MPALILASTSPYRQALLKRLGLAFEVCPPQVAETAHEFESPQALCLRLAREKAAAVAKRFTQSVVIGSDQVAVCGGQRLDKPETMERALDQLRLQRGRWTDFHTAVCVAKNGGSICAFEIVTTRVKFLPAKTLTDDLLRAYLKAEQPLDCAGAAKSEGLGISLIESIEGPDPTALIGLPLIALARLLRQMGVEPLNP